jgi:glycosyltransferase involved in cell wall biosynthesis
MKRSGHAEAPAVEIALATYNGARHIEAQLDSYVSQSFTDWGLLVRDDGSSDATVELIRGHAARHRYPLRFTDDSGTREGYPDTFYTLLEQSRSPIVLFSDQDDVWLPEKLSLFVRTLRELPEGRPALVHSDLRVVSEELEQLSPSYLRQIRAYPPHSDSVLGLLCWNYVTGCASGFNARAREVFRRPEARTGHDAWVALTCAALGSVTFLDVQTVLYRQHGKNLVGAGLRPPHRDGKYWWKLPFDERRSRNRGPLAIAESLLRCYGPELSERTRRDVTLYATMDTSSWGSLFELYRRGVLPENLEFRRRALVLLAKMQVKDRMLRLEAKLRDRGLA